MEQRLRWMFVVLVTVTFTLMTACGSGGEGESGDGNDGGNNSGGLSTDACDALGLKIINGATCNDSAAPVVEFTVTYQDFPNTSCSGTLLTSQDVLTAGHCFVNFGRSVVAIDVRAGGTIIPATGFSIHPGFQEVQDDSILGGIAIINDVAMVRLAQPAPVPSVPLLMSRGTQTGDIISIFGYGLDEDGDSGRLESGEMQLDQVTEDVIVSIFDGTGSNTCQGDSGGPAIFTLNGQAGIVGITSSGVAGAACRKGDISVFTNTQAPSVRGFIFDLVPDAGRI